MVTTRPNITAGKSAPIALNNVRLDCYSLVGIIAISFRFFYFGPD